MQTSSATEPNVCLLAGPLGAATSALLPRPSEPSRAMDPVEAQERHRHREGGALVHVNERVVLDDVKQVGRRAAFREAFPESPRWRELSPGRSVAG
ncbi:MAG: hypothetical protein IPM35_35340 [Myxococcales bacterium]|nr:hypothetical protein [Myxococcales bacterium]